MYNTVLLPVAASIASRFHITKYPTLKLLRNGQATKREYRGQRSADAFASYIKEQLRDPIKILESLNEIKDLEVRTTTFVFVKCMRWLVSKSRTEVKRRGSCQKIPNCKTLRKLLFILTSHLYFWVGSAKEHFQLFCITPVAVTIMNVQLGLSWPHYDSVSAECTLSKSSEHFHACAQYFFTFKSWSTAYKCYMFVSFHSHAQYLPDTVSPTGDEKDCDWLF